MNVNDERRPGAGAARKVKSLLDERDISSVPNADDNAWRCWTWRTVRCCGCGRPADCILTVPPTLHRDTGCPGEFSAGGRYRAHCGDAA